MRTANIKKCYRCKIEKERSEFSGNKVSEDGLKYICKKCVCKISKEYRKNNKEKIAKRKKEYNKKNAVKIAEYHKEYKKNRLKTDINYKLSHNLRIRLYCALKNNQKVGSAIKDLGCSIDELKLYFSRLFYTHPTTGEMMSWENYGKWHIDHYLPLASFDLTDRGDFLEASHYTNLQPMWAEENLSKGAKV